MDFPGVVARDLCWLEIVERPSEIVALAQDRDPGQAGLEPVEDEFLKKRPVVVFRHTPLGVVVGHVERVFAGPRAPRLAIGMQARRAAHATVCFVADRTESASARRSPRPPATRSAPTRSATFCLSSSGMRIRQPSASLRGSANDRSGLTVKSPSQAASTPRLSDRFSTVTLARNL